MVIYYYLYLSLGKVKEVGSESVSIFFVKLLFKIPNKHWSQITIRQYTLYRNYKSLRNGLVFISET